MYLAVVLALPPSLGAGTRGPAGPRGGVRARPDRGLPGPRHGVPAVAEPSLRPADRLGLRRLPRRDRAGLGRGRARHGVPRRGRGGRRRAPGPAAAVGAAGHPRRRAAPEARGTGGGRPRVALAGPGRAGGEGRRRDARLPGHRRATRTARSAASPPSCATSGSSPRPPRTTRSATWRRRTCSPGSAARTSCSCSWRATAGWRSRGRRSRRESTRCSPPAPRSSTGPASPAGAPS